MKTFIIDDDPISLFLTEQTLRVEGFSEDICCFMEAEAALNHITSDIRNNPPDVFFLDVNMPYMNGWEFLDALRPYAGQLTECRIYILTSSLDISDHEKVKEYPFVHRLFHKPISNEDVQVILSEKRSEAN
ncbi:CheY-like chemotaxis protein [Pontibacter ummariensis]|uniref:CheY chemotaxis protein or a CheY-like REC (Receiver) domain n=1 Tax=Pontibacter ummariensis TaxID=1610492 RepID=A0A239ERQ1_9BACT|nr:response regulator [Pontibacter ummariensis]PRY12811.1 CheY-like chemotaxis protein [Pontibacter ummariensis]SNS46592.1 CheY chemotaxis protein or a CheY-like REC (receiver) domain [Pontibacter ummariensis]